MTIAWLRNLKIREVSSVDRGAGEGVQVLLSKKDKSQLTPEQDKQARQTIAHGADHVVDALREALKTHINDENRTAVEHELARAKSNFIDQLNSGKEFEKPDGVEKAFNPDQPRAADGKWGEGGSTGEKPEEFGNRLHDFSHSLKMIAGSAVVRAAMPAVASLGPGALIPTAIVAGIASAAMTYYGWAATTQLAGYMIAGERYRKNDPNGDLAKAEEFASEGMDDIFSAVYALQKSVASIVEDETVPDVKKALEDTFSQFKAYIGRESTMADDPVLLAKVSKAEKDCEAANLAKAAAEKALRKAKIEIGFLKMSDKHRSYAEDSDMDEDEKADFADKSPAERDAHMEKNPLEKRLSPNALAKRLETADLRKRVDELTKRDEAVTFAKRAADMGMPESFGEILAKARKSPDEKDRGEACDEMEKTIAALTKQVKTGGLFKEFGSSRGGAASGTAVSEVAAKAAELQKVDSRLDRVTAHAKVLTDPANAELFKRYRAETESSKAA